MNTAEDAPTGRDGSRLDLAMTITDPVYFTEPATVQKYWLYFEDAEVGAFQYFTGAED